MSAVRDFRFNLDSIDEQRTLQTSNQENEAEEEEEEVEEDNE